MMQKMFKPRNASIDTTRAVCWVEGGSTQRIGHRSVSVQ
jgi:hypothetical protein